MSLCDAAFSARRAFSLLELVVTLAIITIFVAMLLPAVQKVRETARRVSSQNNLRQIGIALHHYNSTHSDMLPGWPSATAVPWARTPIVTPLHGLVPYLDAELPSVIPGSPINGNEDPRLYDFIPLRKTFMSPGDPTLVHAERTAAASSYAANMVAFVGPPKLINIRDGTSSTIAYVERFYRSRVIEPRWPGPEPLYSTFSYFEVDPAELPNQLNGHRRATFADRGWRGDILPVTSGSPPTTRASVPGMTFQVKPTPDDALAYIPQTPFTAGLPVALFDGSVRTLNPKISEGTFWSIVTPAAGDIPGDW